jgi:hypothetical protein
MAEKILNTQKSIAGQKEGAAGSSGVREYEVSTNVARDSNEVKRTRMYVEKNDGTNISGVIIPHHTQIGLSDPNFKSDLGVKGRLQVDSDLIVNGEILGSHHTLEDGETDAFASIDSRFVKVEVSETVKGQVIIGLNIANAASTGQVLSFDATTNRLKFIDVVGGAVAFLFASSIAQFTVSEASMIGFAAANAFDPITNGTTVVATVGHA